MIPKKLTIQGSLGILAGLGRDELSIDLDEIIPSEAVTVALKGDNGSGKSTLFNLALTPWREPPMCPDGLYSEFGPKGLRELVFHHGDHLYKSRIEIRQTPKTKSQKAFLWQMDYAGEWAPYTMPDRTISDGKTRTYDACLEHVLGPQSLYYLAAFRAQNTAKLAEYAYPKDLMRDLLALDEPQALRSRSKIVVRELNREYEYVKDLAGELGDKAVLLSGLVLQTETMANELPAATQTQVKAAEAVGLARADFEAATKDEADIVKLRQQHEAMERRIDAANLKARADESQAERGLAAAQSRAAAAKGSKNNRALTVMSRKNRAEKLLSSRESVAKAVSEVEELLGQIPAQDDVVEELRKRKTQAMELIATQKTLEEQRNSCASIGKTRVIALQKLQQQADYIAVVPCKGEPPYDGCPALKGAIEAKGGIPGIQVDIEKGRSEWNQFTRELKEIGKEIDALTTETADLSYQESQAKALRERLSDARETAALESQIDQAAADLAAAEGELAALEAEYEENANALEAEVQEAKLRLDILSTDNHDALADLQMERAALPPLDHTRRLEAARAALEAAQNKQSAANQAADKKSADLAEARARADALKAEIDAGDDIRKTAKRLESEISEWNLLAIALQGVIDLSIEDAGPAISTTANGLLAEAYGPRFTISMVTQRTQANGNLVECFDISVVDGDSGIESSILKKSGGESVWLDKSLTDSVGLYHQDSAGINYECLFADESEDGLTQDRKQRFYKMDRAALALGGYKRKFFVSHHPEAWAMADAVIDLEAFRV